MRAELAAIDEALEAAQSPRLRQLVLIRRNDRFLDRLVESLERQESSRLRLGAQREDLEERVADMKRQIAQVCSNLWALGVGNMVDMVGFVKGLRYWWRNRPCCSCLLLLGWCCRRCIRVCVA